MPIHVPGKRGHGGRVNIGRRSAVAALNITPMVDLFTVLVVFLLQSYATTNQILPLPDKVQLPTAHAVKELKPSTVVVVSRDGILVNTTKVADFLTVKEQKDWLIPTLEDSVKQAIQTGEQKEHTITSQLRQAIDDAKQLPKSQDIADYMKLTIQADKSIDFLTIKKIMYTVTEAGIQEINFAVIKRTDKAKPL